MTRPFPRKIDLQSPIKDLRVEWVDDHWRIWLNANKDWTLGTYIHLECNGNIQRVTWHPDGTESVFDISEKEDSENG